MKCRGLPPAVFWPAGAEGSAPEGFEGIVEPCMGTSSHSLCLLMSGLETGMAVAPVNPPNPQRFCQMFTLAAGWL